MNASRQPKSLTPATGVASEARPLLRLLAPGQSVVIALAEGLFWRQESYRAVNSAARTVLGAGWYQMSSEHGSASVRVTRLETRRPGPWWRRSPDEPAADEPGSVVDAR